VSALKPILDIRDLSVNFYTDLGTVRALNGVNLELRDGETLGLVGETGAGKTTLARSIMRLVPIPGKVERGQVLFEDSDLLMRSESDMLSVRGKKISMIFQDPMSVLNPVIAVGDQIMETILTHERISSRAAREKALDMLVTVGISADRAIDYPHQFSGGMKQRVVIAIALACNPKVLVADEPTSALDVTIQAQVLDLMAEFKKKFEMSILMITHDLGIVAQTCERVAVLYAGEVVESGFTRDIFKNTGHPYTDGLLGAIPKIHVAEDRLRPIFGLMPDPTNLPEGCFFQDRCKLADAPCASGHPQLEPVGHGHMVRCLKAASR
jgi:peptide/nickel transport system ATP-binding protein